MAHVQYLRRGPVGFLFERIMAGTDAQALLYAQGLFLAAAFALAVHARRAAAGAFSLQQKMTGCRLRRGGGSGFH